MYDLRFSFAYLIPGLLLVFNLIYIDVLVFDNSKLTDNAFHIILGIIASIFVDITRHRFEKKITFLNFFSFRILVKKIVLFFFRSLDYKVINIKTAIVDYDFKEREILKFWISKNLKKNKLGKKVKKFNLQTEYGTNFFSSGDKWAIINLISKDSTEFYLKEYFSYYQFVFNCFIVSIINLLISVFSMILFYNYELKFIQSIIINLILLLFLYERTIHWYFSCRRFIRKVISYSAIYEQ